MNPADPLKSVPHGCFFNAEFRLISQVAETAAAALLVDRAVRFDPFGREAVECRCNSIGVPAQHFDNFNVAYIARGCLRHKNNHAANPANAKSFPGNGQDFSFIAFVFLKSRGLVHLVTSISIVKIPRFKTGDFFSAPCSNQAGFRIYNSRSSGWDSSLWRACQSEYSTPSRLHRSSIQTILREVRP